MSITVHIERLILDGVSIPQRQRPQVQVAFEVELARLIIAEGLGIDLQTNGMQPCISGGDIQLEDVNDPAQLGKRIAKAVYKGIGQ